MQAETPCIEDVFLKLYWKYYLSTSKEGYICRPSSNRLSGKICSEPAVYVVRQQCIQFVNLVNFCATLHCVPHTHPHL